MDAVSDNEFISTKRNKNNV